MIFLNATASSLFLGLSGIAPLSPQKQMHRLSPKNGFTAAVSFCRRGFTKSFSLSRKFAAVALRNHSVAAERNAAYYKPFMCFFSDAPKDRYTTGTIQYNGRRE